MAAVIQISSNLPRVLDIVTVLDTDDMEGYRLVCSMTGVDRCLGIEESDRWPSLEPAVMAAVDHIRRHESRMPALPTGDARTGSASEYLQRFVGGRAGTCTLTMAHTRQVCGDPFCRES